MMMRWVILSACLIALVSFAQADPPENYYTTTTDKTGNELRSALHEIIDDHSVIKYSSSNPDTADALAKLDKFNSPDWKPRRWAWIDPEKDINAQIKAVENQFKSKRQVISESGGDIEDVFKDIKRDEELAEDVGLEKRSE